MNNEHNPRDLEEQGMPIYFKGTRDICSINLREQGISLLFKATLTKKVKEQWN